MRSLVRGFRVLCGCRRRLESLGLLNGAGLVGVVALRDVRHLLFLVLFKKAKHVYIFAMTTKKSAKRHPLATYSLMAALGYLMLEGELDN